MDDLINLGLFRSWDPMLGVGIRHVLAMCCKLKDGITGLKGIGHLPQLEMLV